MAFGDGSRLPLWRKGSVPIPHLFRRLILKKILQSIIANASITIKMTGFALNGIWGRVPIAIMGKRRPLPSVFVRKAHPKEDSSILVTALGSESKTKCTLFSSRTASFPSNQNDGFWFEWCIRLSFVSNTSNQLSSPKGYGCLYQKRVLSSSRVDDNFV